MQEKKQKNNSTPKSSIGVDVEQNFEINTNNIIPQKEVEYNKQIVTNFFDTSLEEVINKIKLLLRNEKTSDLNNDINTARIFFKCFEDKIVYVIEPKCWYAYNGKYWSKDDGGLLLMEVIKLFVLAYIEYAEQLDEEELTKYTKKLCSRSRRESLIKDSSSIAPKSFEMFDSHKLLFNCKNGTYNLQSNKLQQHNPFDYITKIANVSFDANANCDRWKQFISEIMQENEENGRFLQKSFGYALSGETNLECFFIFYGSITRK